MIEENTARLTELEAERELLTDAEELKSNKREITILTADTNYARTRSDELLVLYERLLEEKAAREEEQKFQDQIDAEYDRMDELGPMMNNMYTAMERLWREYDMMESEADREQQHARIEYLQTQID